MVARSFPPPQAAAMRASNTTLPRIRVALRGFVRRIVVIRTSVHRPRAGLDGGRERRCSRGTVRRSETDEESPAEPTGNIYYSGTTTKIVDTTSRPGGKPFL